MNKNSVIDDLLNEITSANPDQPEFLQAIDEMAQSIGGWYGKQKDFRKSRIFQRLAEPDRVISFRVSWRDDKGVLQHNRGWRVQFSHILGPYKGGLRFAPSVTESVLKFLGYEQIFKNALTGLPMGGGGEGRLKLRSQRKKPGRNRTFLPILHDGAITSHRPGHRCAGGRYRRRSTGN